MEYKKEPGLIKIQWINGNFVETVWCIDSVTKGDIVIYDGKI